MGIILKPGSSLTLILNQNTQKHLESLPFHILLSCPGSGNIVFSWHSCHTSFWHWPRCLRCRECSFQQPPGGRKIPVYETHPEGHRRMTYLPRAAPFTWRCRQALHGCFSVSVKRSTSFCFHPRNWVLLHFWPLPPVSPRNHWGQRIYVVVFPELILMLNM